MSVSGGGGKPAILVIPEDLAREVLRRSEESYIVPATVVYRAIDLWLRGLIVAFDKLSRKVGPTPENG